MSLQTIHSPWLGDVESDPQCELLFPAGLPGFEEQHRMLPVEIPEAQYSATTVPFVVGPPYMAVGPI